MFVLMTWFALNESAFDDLSNDLMRVSSYVQGAGNIGADCVLYIKELTLNWRKPFLRETLACQSGPSTGT
jgi:hypothetical protein